MSPSWNPIADEAVRLAADRDLAASREPRPRECHLLRREAVLLRRAAAHARGGPSDGAMVHAACEGVVVHAGSVVLWGITAEGEAALRALAADDALDAHEVDAGSVLRAILGLPAELAGRTSVVV